MPEHIKLRLVVPREDFPHAEELAGLTGQQFTLGHVSLTAAEVILTLEPVVAEPVVVKEQSE